MVGVGGRSTFYIHTGYKINHVSKFYERKKPLFVIGHMTPEQNFYIQYIMKYMVT